MKFKIDCAEFLKTLTHLQGIVDKKNSLPILSNILIEASANELTLSSTDMDISIIEKIDCNVLEDGATTINSQILYDIVRKLDENCEIEIISNNGKLLTLRASGSRFSLACLPKEDYPIIDQDNSGTSISINSKILFKLIDKTKFAISNEETRSKKNEKIFYSEIELSKIQAMVERIPEKNLEFPKKFNYQKVSEFPSISRDISFLVKDFDLIEDLATKVNEININILKEYLMFDYFEKDDEVKIGYRFVFQSRKRTLQDSEVDKIIDDIVESLTVSEKVYVPGYKYD